VRDKETGMSLLDHYLLPNERAALADALRRDFENERARALRHPQRRAYHLQNVRLNLRILEAFDYRPERDTPSARLEQ
jgi:hypothetical protein